VVFGRQKKELEAQVKVQVDENEKLRNMIRALQVQVAAEIDRLNKANDRK